MKKFFKAGVLAICCTLAATLSGCMLYNDPSQPSTGLNAMSGYKICYNDNNYQVDNTFSVYAEHILGELFSVFAMPSSTSPQSDLQNKPLSTVSGNYDRIRVQKSPAGQAVSPSWKWTFAKSLADCEAQTDFTNTISYFTPQRQALYYEEFKSLYLIPLEVVAMQIASGQNPQVFTVEVSEATGKTSVYTSPQKTTLADESFLSSAKQTFATNGTYVGFTAENVATFKNYILTEIVGSSIIGSAYDSVQTSEGTLTYSALLDEILKLSAGTLRSFYSPYPASTVLDVTDTSYYPNTTKQDPFQDIPLYEYQSITFMPSKNVDFLSMTFSFWAETDLNIDITAVYYNHLTQSSETLFSGTANYQKNKNGGELLYLLALTRNTTLSAFGENFMSATSSQQISNQNSLSTYFMYENGAQIDKNAFGGSYLTITFKPQGAENGYCPFKWAISSMLIGE